MVANEFPWVIGEVILRSGLATLFGWLMAETTIKAEQRCSHGCEVDVDIWNQVAIVQRALQALGDPHSLPLKLNEISDYDSMH